MKSVNDGTFRVDPFEFDSIQELKIEKDLNEHTTLYVRGTAKIGWQYMPVTDSAEYTNIKCQDEDNVYFSGVLQNVVITYVDDVYHLEAHAISHTIKLDTERHKRAFQDTGWSYMDIVDAIITEGGGVVNYHADVEAVDRILVQYDETDWQFAKRLASHTQDVLTPVSTSDEPEFRFGLEDESSVGEVSATTFSVFKDFDLLRSRANDEQPLDEESITMYKLKTDDFFYGMFDTGEKVKLGEQELYVRHAELTLEDSVIYCMYILASKSAITAPKTFNRNITGLALPGIVQVVENDDILLDLDIDYTPGTVQFFKYATDYSPVSHTGWYVMPEIGDTVFLSFPTEDEKDAHASNSIRRNGTDRTGDPLTKYLRNTFGKEIKLDMNEVLITGEDDQTFVRINEGSGIEIHTIKPIKIFSDQTLDMTSTGDMSITTMANLSITARDSITMSCSENGENVITITPPAGIDVYTDQQFNGYSLDSTNYKSDNEINIDATNDMNIITTANLAVAATDSITVSNSEGGENVLIATPGDGISIKTDQQLNVLAHNDANIKTDTKMNVRSDDDMFVSTGTNLAVDAPDSITVTCTENAIRIEPASGIAVSTDQQLNVHSQNDVNIKTDTVMTVRSDDDMFVSTGTNLAVDAPDSINVSCSENVIDIRPASGIAASTDQEFNVLSTSNTSIQSRAKLSVQSSDDMSISSDKKLIESGKTAVTISNMMNTMAMTPAAGVNIATPMKLNMASKLDATIASKKGLNLSALKDLKATAGAKLVESGNTAVEVSSGGSSLKMKPAVVDIKSPAIKQN